jgi:competence protein ComEC
VADESRGRARTTTWPPRNAAAGQAAPSGRLLRHYLGRALEWLRLSLAAEAARAQLLPWIAVAYGVGIVLYFTAEREPLVSVVVPIAAVGSIVAFLVRRSRFFPAAVMTASICAGFATATVRTTIVAHDVLVRPLYSVALSGFVEVREEREKTDRFVLRVTSMDDLRGARRALPEVQRVRLSVKKGTAPIVGSFAELKASLSAPLTPLRPGSYDFARMLYFQGIGATGFVHGPIKVTAPPEDGGLWLVYAVVVNKLQNAMDARIRQSLSGDNRAIASALLHGKRDAITTPVNDAMFISGLGHVLSISGYHMAVVAGIIFFVVRALLALFPPLTNGYPVKKWAALVAFAASLFYLLLSGNQVATQRSFFMTAVVLIAVMVDRRAITFRTLAVAALVVLFFAPESIVDPSFQMSFAATLGLVALVNGGLPRLASASDNSLVGRIALWGGREVISLAFASMVAGFATTPYAAFVFHRATPYGILANLMAMPVVSAWVMPAGLLGIVAMPFGFDGVFWRLMDVGLDWMVWVSLWVASLPGAIGHVPAFGSGALVLSTVGILILGLLKTSLRWSGAIVVAAAVIWVLATPQPDILVGADGVSVAARGADGRLSMVQTRKDLFLAKEWLAADADARLVTDPSVMQGGACDAAGCALKLSDGRYVAITRRADAFADDCEKALLIVTFRQPPPGCRAAVLGRDQLRSSGSMAIWRSRDGLVIEAARPKGFDRPWAHSDMAGQAAPAVLGETAPAARPVDTTPSEPEVAPDDQ